jgi:hypothetical protein
MTLAVPRASYGAIIGENGATLHQLMSECRVMIEVPKADSIGHVKVHGLLEDCLRVQQKLEKILKDSLQVLSSDAGHTPVMPKPCGYDLATSAPIARSLFFPEKISECSEDGLTSLATLLKFLDSTEVSCDVCVFTITDNRIARRLLDAYRYRNVKLRIVTDNAQSDALGSDVAELQAAGIEVRTNTSQHHMHHKFCILDERVLMNGSFNWTQGACENNFENVMITNENAFVSAFRAEFEQLWQVCVPLGSSH